MPAKKFNNDDGQTENNISISSSSSRSSSSIHSGAGHIRCPQNPIAIWVAMARRGGRHSATRCILHLMDMLSMRQLNGFCCPSWATGSHQHPPDHHQLEQKQRQRQQKRQQQQHQRRRPVWPIHAQSLWPQRQSQMHMGASAVLLLSATTHLMLSWGISTSQQCHLCLGHGKGSSNNTSTQTQSLTGRRRAAAAASRDCNSMVHRL
ncbi:hypothetical protein ACLKA6_004549 [Drosophila palustris]